MSSRSEDRLRVGDRVQVKPASEILATLDENGCLDGQPFMPEMLDMIGKPFRVSARAERVCDTISPEVGTRLLKDTVLLDDVVRCHGEAHGGCQARCLIYWKEGWLRPADGVARTADPESDPGLEALRQLVGRNTTTRSIDTPGQTVFRCQATELQRAGDPIPVRSLRSLFDQLSNGVKLITFVRVLARLGVRQVGIRLGLVPLGPFKASMLGRLSTVPGSDNAGSRVFAPGDVVRVRSKEEIARTLDTAGKNRGLWFDREMLRLCGQTTTVTGTVERFVDEGSGRLVELKSDCYILEDSVCLGEEMAVKCLCPRRILPWWRGCWLDSVDGEVVRSG
jgi:hypothetical protein